MALINCPECNKEINDKSESCPNCGFKLKTEDKAKGKPKTSHNIGCVVFAIVVIIAIYLMLSNGSDDTPWQERDESIMAYIMTEDWVKKRLVSPSTAKFPGASEKERIQPPGATRLM